jgi:hypothetical protein
MRKISVAIVSVLIAVVIYKMATKAENVEEKNKKDSYASHESEPPNQKVAGHRDLWTLWTITSTLFYNIERFRDMVIETKYLPRFLPL